MILVQLALDEEGQCSGFTKSTTVSTYYLMRDLWQGFVAEGLITQVKKIRTSSVGSEANTFVLLTQSEI